MQLCLKFRQHVNSSVQSVQSCYLARKPKWPEKLLEYLLYAKSYKIYKRAFFFFSFYSCNLNSVGWANLKHRTVFLSNSFQNVYFSYSLKIERHLKAFSSPVLLKVGPRGRPWHQEKAGESWSYRVLTEAHTGSEQLWGACWAWLRGPLSHFNWFNSKQILNKTAITLMFTIGKQR